MTRLLIFCLLFGVSQLFAQRPSSQYSTSSKKAIKLYHLSQQQINQRDYSGAIKSLEEAIEKDSKFAEAYIRLGGAHKFLRDFDKAFQLYNNALELKPNSKYHAGLYFSLAEVGYHLGEYDLSAKLCMQYLGYNIGTTERRRRAQLLLDNPSFAIQSKQRGININPRPLSDTVNRYQLQYFPVVTADQKQLIFTKRDSENGQEDLVVSTRQNGKWGVPISISENINTEFNEGTCTVSADGRMIIFTSCLGRAGEGSCDLYVAFRTGEEWSEPKNMGKSINSRAWDSQPAISADGRTLYFVSTRGGGEGSRDIWVSKLSSTGEWSKAENLGPQINSRGDDISPFIHVNGQTLYFASNGRVGLGGFDLFYSELADEQWENPVNLGFPINNQDDQVSVVVTADGSKGYYSYEVVSNGSSKSSNLYEFDMPDEWRVKNRSNYIAGKIFNEQTGEPLMARIELYDVEQNELVSVIKSDSITGEYLMVLTEGEKYGPYVEKIGYLFRSEFFDYDNKLDLKPINLDIELSPIRSGISVVLNNIFFETDKYELGPESKTELEKVILFLTQNLNIKIEVAGHTDDVGSASYNLELSKNRALAVANYILSKGLNAKRIIARGYAAQFPSLPNISEKNRSKNRRIEFKIL